MSSGYSHDHDAQQRGFLTSRIGVAHFWLIVVTGLLLGVEQRAHIFTHDWFWIVVLLLCFRMHHFMHGRHGGHGSRGGRREKIRDHEKPWEG